MGAYLLTSKEPVTLVTAENNPDRIAEDKKLQEYIPNITEYITLYIPDIDYSKFCKGYKNVSLANVMQYIKDTEYPIDEVKDKLKKLSTEELYIPLGVGHPFHVLLSYLIGKAKGYYRDFPHSYKAKNLAHYYTTIQNKKLICKNNDKDMLKKKIDIFHNVYKSQKGFAWYEQQKLANPPEEEIWEINNE
jgi:hypothetical protein